MQPTSAASNNWATRSKSRRRRWVPPDPRRAARNPIAISCELISAGQWDSRMTLPEHNGSTDSLRSGSSGDPGIPTISNFPSVVELSDVASPAELHASSRAPVELDAVKTQRYEMPAHVPVTFGVHRAASTIQESGRHSGEQSNVSATNRSRGQIKAEDEYDDLYAMPSPRSPPQVSRYPFKLGNLSKPGNTESQTLSSREQTLPRGASAAPSNNFLPNGGQSSSSREQTSPRNVDAASSSRFIPNEGALSALEEFGIPIILAEKALYATGNSDPDVAVDWIFAHMEDPDIDHPLTMSVVQTREALPSST
jgi:hypothetical protein